MRPFGYDTDFVTVLPAEAQTYRTLVARFLAGESTRSLAVWLNEAEVPTVTGSSWTTSTLKGMLTNGRYAGLRVHRGQAVAPAIWEAIITEDEHRRVLAMFADKKMSGRRAPQRYLLSGLLRCGRCGNGLFSSSRVIRGRANRRYVCASGPDHGGCGRIMVSADPLERLIADFVLHRLDTPELADVLAGRNGADARTQELTQALDQDQQHLDDLAQAHGRGEVTMREWMLAKQPIQ